MDNDFQEFYRVDLSAAAMSWRRFSVKVLGLLDMPPWNDPRDNNKPHHRSRLGRRLHPAE